MCLSKIRYHVSRCCAESTICWIFTVFIEISLFNQLVISASVAHASKRSHVSIVAQSRSSGNATYPNSSWQAKKIRIGTTTELVSVKRQALLNPCLQDLQQKYTIIHPTTFKGGIDVYLRMSNSQIFGLSDNHTRATVDSDAKGVFCTRAGA